jgi:hypothetical protein
MSWFISNPVSATKSETPHVPDVPVEGTTRSRPQAA